MTAIRYALILALVFLPASPFATTFPVTKIDDTNDGTCDPDCSLREAIEAANTNPGADDVPVPAGFYLLTLGQLVVTDDVSIAGAGQVDTIIDGNAADRVFYNSAVTEILGVTIQNGDTLLGGGGIFNNSGDLTLNDSTISGNSAAIESPYCTTGSSGGGIYNNYGWLTLTNCTVQHNIGNSGAGIHNQYGRATIANSTVSGNVGQCVYGGFYEKHLDGSAGISNDGGTLTLANSTVRDNVALFGGGIGNSGDLTVTNSTVSGNAATFGGGIINGGTLALNGSTISGNTSGGGIHNTNGVVYLNGSIVADNSVLSAANCGGEPLNSLGYNLADDNSCGFTEPSDLVVTDAMLGPLQDNGGPTETHDLLPGSPAIDAGSMDCPPPDTDQRGVARPQGAGCDIGAVEYLPEPAGWMMLVAGTASLGLLYRRRARGMRIG